LRRGQDFPALTSRIRIIGYGYQLSRGIKAGRISEMEPAERTIRNVVAKAERAADVTVNEVYVTSGFGPLASQSFTANVDLPGGTVTVRDMDRVMRAAREYSSRLGKTVLHASPFGYTLGYETGIADPLGMIGDMLKVDVHAVAVNDLVLKNLKHCIQRSHLSVAGVAAAAYASGMAVVSESEMQNGVTCLDMGAGATGVSVFSQGSFVYCDSVEIGGNHITNDIAHAFSVSLIEAERLKTLYASVLVAPEDVCEPVIAEHDDDIDADILARNISKAELSDIARTRLEQTFVEVRDRLRASGMEPMSGQRLILTGGASELMGAAELAGQIFGKQPRLGRPRPVAGLPRPEAGPAFAAPIGVLIHLLDDDLNMDISIAPEIIATSQGYLARVGQWLRESF
jgi:cell division protein FtsA